MSWGLGWKRPSDVFHLTLSYGADDFLDDATPTSSRSSSAAASPFAAASPTAAFQDGQQLGFRIELDWNAGDDEDQVALKLQSQVMVALPSPQDTVEVELTARGEEVGVEMRVMKRIEPLQGVIMGRAGGSGQQGDGMGVLLKLMRSNFSNGVGSGADGEALLGCAEHWRSVTVVSLAGLGLTGLPVEISQLPLLEKLYLDNNKLATLPPELGELKNLKVLAADSNMLVSVPVELRQCVGLVELSLEHNKLVRPLLDFRAMTELRVQNTEQWQIWTKSVSLDDFDPFVFLLKL